MTIIDGGIKALRALLPASFRGYLTRTLSPYFIQEEKKKYGCPVCGAQVARFNLLYDAHLQGYEEHGYIYPLYFWETFNYLHYRCPRCDASDRDRLYALFLQRKFGALDRSRKYKFIDFAPAPALSKMIAGFDCIEYRSADLMMEHVDDRVDITDLSLYADNAFDFLLCSHVLEHVPDDRQAMRELYRILKPGGWGIVMVPILTALEKTHEDPSLASAAERWKYYGQHDHVRMYAKKDFIARLTEAGFRVSLYDASFFSRELFAHNGIHAGSVLYVAEK